MDCPIPLLYNIGKTFERIIYNRLYKFLESKNLIIYLQFDFPTSHALIHLTDKIREQLGTGNFVCGIFADFQRIFDTFDHVILIQKLNYYGVGGTANNWLSSGFENRS